MLLCPQEETPGTGIGIESNTAEECLGTAGVVMAAEWKVLQHQVLGHLSEN